MGFCSHASSCSVGLSESSSRVHDARWEPPLPHHSPSQLPQLQPSDETSVGRVGRFILIIRKCNNDIWPHKPHWPHWPTRDISCSPWPASHWSCAEVPAKTCSKLETSMRSVPTVPFKTNCIQLRQLPNTILTTQLHWKFIEIRRPPAASRGSASEEALLATRGEERKLLDKHGRLRHGACDTVPATRCLRQRCLRHQKATFGTLGYGAAGPIRPSLPCCFSPATRSSDSSLVRSCCRTKASSGRTRAGWQLAVQKRR